VALGNHLRAYQNVVVTFAETVKDGFELVGKTEQEFREVADGVEKSSELVGEITAASQEQAQGIEQINKAVSEMDKVVQQTAANSEEAAAASEEMSAQAEQMKHFVRELRGLVEGAKVNGVAARTESVSTRPPAPKAGRKLSKALSGYVKRDKGNGKDHGGFTKVVTPAKQLIPLDDREMGAF
jgi:methyl-accepting chemotaxis protein